MLRHRGAPLLGRHAQPQFPLFGAPRFLGAMLSHSSPSSCSLSAALLAGAQQPHRFLPMHGPRRPGCGNLRHDGAWKILLCTSGPALTGRSSGGASWQTHGRRGRSDGARALFGWMQGRTPPPPEAPVGAGPDPYAWLQHGDERHIQRYLEAENKYARAALRPVRKLERTLLQAMTGRLDEHEHGEPERIEQWYYYMRTREGSAFPIYCRTERLEGGSEEVLLDQDEMAQRLPYLVVPQCKISPCHTKLAYTADTTGSERYTGFIKDLSSGAIVCEVPDVTTLEWACDGKTILYTQPDHHRRPFRVWRRFVEGDARAEIVLEV